MASSNISARALQDYEALMQERIYEAAERSLYVFIKAAWGLINGEDFVDNWHIGCLAEHMQEFLKKKDSAIGNRLLINISPRCLDGETQIIMADGSLKKIKDIVVGDYVISADNSFNKVTATYDQGYRQGYKITLSTGESVIASKDHKFMTWEAYKKVSDLVVGDDLELVKKYTPAITEDKITSQEARLLALWLAEGHKTQRTMTITNTEYKIREQVIKDIAVINPTWRFKEKASEPITFSIVSSNIKDVENLPMTWLHQYVDKCTTYDWHIPSLLWSSSDDIICDFLGMFIATDGYICKTKKGQTRIGITLACESAIHELSWLFKRIGVSSNIIYKKSKCNGKSFDSWILDINGTENLLICKEKLDGKLFQKQQKLDTFLKSQSGSNKQEIPYQWVIGSEGRDYYKNRIIEQKRWTNKTNILHSKTIKPSQQVLDKINSNSSWRKIKSIELLEDPIHLFDITVANTHNFVLANSIKSSNSGKTMLTTVMGTAWQWLQDPTYKIIHTVHTERLYVRNIASLRQLISSPWYKDRWCDPSFKEHYKYAISGSQNTKTWLQLDEGGEFYGTSPGSSNVYGAGADLLSIDDPTDGSSAHQPIMLERANRFYSQTLKTRLNNKKTGKIMIVQQRLAQNDLSGWVLDNEREDYFHLNIPMLYDSRRTFISPIGFNDPRKKDGDALDPIRFPPEFINTEKKNFSYFQTQYQQDPVPEGGNLIQLEWLQYYNHHDFDNLFSSTVSHWLSIWDLSFDGGINNDYTVGLVLAYTTDGKFVIYDLWREKATFTRQLQMMRELVNKHPQVQTHLIENLANGTALINTLQREINGLTPILPRTYGHSKSMRLQACVPAIMEGRLWIPRDTVYSVDIVKELVGFPLAGADDIVDCVAYGINHCLSTQDIGTVYTGLHKMTDTPPTTEEKARALSTLAYDYQKERIDVLGSTSNSNIRSIFY